jgi:hypothetical protein
LLLGPSRERERGRPGTKELHTKNRRRLRLLDACLHELEDAHERGETLVSGDLALKVGPHVPGIVRSMPINAAIDRVLAAQEPHLGGAGPQMTVLKDVREPDPDERVERTERPLPAVIAGRVPALRNGRGLLEPASARELTNRIRTATRHVCLLLLEAHQGRAWFVLGYRTWEEYIQSEFGLSRSRSYELLDQARVILAIMEAAEVSAIPDVSAYTALQLKPYLYEVTETIRARVGDGDQVDPRAVISEVIEQKRAVAGPRGRHRRERQAAADDGMPTERLVEVIEYLATMPPVTEALAAIDETRTLEPVQLRRALAWLSDLVKAFPGEASNAV